MKRLQAETKTKRSRSMLNPSDDLRIAVTFRRPTDRLGPTKLAARLSTNSVMSFQPDPLDVDRAVHELQRHGFTATARGKMTLSVRGSRASFEKLFGTKLTRFRIDPTQPANFHSFYFPAPGAPWSPDPALMQLIDDAYIQWPHIYMAGRRGGRTTARRRGASRAGARATAMAGGASSASAKPPQVGYFHLEVPGDVPALLNATAVHQAGTTGKGVRVAMIDSGFARHPFFTQNGFKKSVVLAPNATHRLSDKNGHGTGESANVFSVAPNATFIGVKLDNDDDPQSGASILEGLQEALKHDPQVISVSLGYDLCESDPYTGERTSNKHLTSLPHNLIALETEIQAAVAAGIVVVFSAGNGHVSFPGMMPEVISAGGVFVDAQGARRASDYASAFQSKIYSGRNVPDFCGLVGMQPHADYIMLPIPPGCEIDDDNSKHDGTTRNDGWGVFSGTSAAAPQLAGVCALLLEKNPGLTPSDVKAVLARTAIDVTTGSANSASNEDNGGMAAGPGVDGATGAGLVDVFRAWQQV